MQKQAIPVPNSYNGIVWNPLGNEIFVADGNMDNVPFYTKKSGAWAAATGSRPSRRTV